MVNFEFPLEKIEIGLGSGIYRITCIKNNKFYIGSSFNITSRWRQHLSNLNRNKHHSKRLQNSFNCYGKNNFTISLIEIVDKSNLLEREQVWLDETKSYIFGFNIVPVAGSCFGMVMPTETKIKISEANATKLNGEKVKEIKNLLSQGIKSTVIAEKFGVSACHIQGIKFGNYWKHIEGNDDGYIYGTKGENNASAKLTSNDVEKIRSMFDQDIKILDIAKNFGVSKPTIEAIKYGRTWKN